MQIYQLEPQIIVPHKWNSHSEKSNLNCKLEKATNEAESLGYPTPILYPTMQSESFQTFTLNVAMKKKLCSLLTKLIKGHLLMAGTRTAKCS